jgi:hypothetical protein
MNVEEKLVEELNKNEQVVQIVSLELLEKEYLNLKGAGKTLAGYVSPIKDASVALKVLNAFGLSASKVMIKQYAGKQYVIFKGYPGQRSLLRGTKYLVSNPKVVRLAIGPKGIVKSVKGGFVLTVVLSVGIEVFDYFMRDTASLSHMLGTITGDLIKIGIGSILAVVAGLVAGSAAVIGTVAVVPFVVAIGVGVATGYILNKVDAKFGATKALILGYKKMGLNIREIKWEYQQNMRRIAENPDFLRCFFMPCFSFGY